MENKENMVIIEDALDLILSRIEPLKCERISLLESSGRILGEDIKSDENIPPLDNSAMDGYAVKSEDTKGASKEKPVKLTVTDEIKAGDSHIGKKVLEGNAIRIMTGAPIPEGADAVIQFEDTSEDGDTVSIYRELKNLENYRYAGEDIKKGATVLSMGNRISSADVGLLASLNYDRVKVYKMPEVAIISTGDELVEIGQELETGQIRNSNAYTLYSDVKKYSAKPRYLGIAKDTIEDTKNIMEKALESDVIITTGGVSMGKYDFVNDVMKELGIDIHFEWIRMKPGKPCIFGTKGDKLFFGLPGNPVSTMTSFLLLVRPAILRLMGAEKIDKPIIRARLRKDIKKKPDRKNYMRGYFTIEDGEVFVSTTGPQGSGILKSMSMANCLIIIPIDTSFVKAGELIDILLMDHEEIY